MEKTFFLAFTGFAFTVFVFGYISLVGIDIYKAGIENGSIQTATVADYEILPGVVSTSEIKLLSKDRVIKTLKNQFRILGWYHSAL
jgi:hypothetical protein